MKFNLNIQIALYGFLIMLIGLVLLPLGSRYPALNLFVIPLTSVGASVLAAGLTSWMVTVHFAGVDVTSIVQALAETSTFIRSDHELKLIISLCAPDHVRVRGEHSFTLVNQRGRRARKKFEIYTDLGSWNNCGGFESVCEPTGNVLHHEALEQCMVEVNGKTYFTKSYDINPKSSATFKFYTFGTYRRTDRLVWTVQDLSTDFKVDIKNETGINDAILIKVNHHREKDILEGLTIVPGNADKQEHFVLHFNCEVLPYQGFEVMWNLDPLPPDRPVRSLAPAEPAAISSSGQ
jgi:hypothetical protein